MGFYSEFRYPTKWYSKLIAAVLALTFFSLLAAAAIAGYVVYRIVTPPRNQTKINLVNFPGHPGMLTYNVPGKGQREGWFFPGLKEAPTVILCPGYDSSRGELLTLATSLQDHQYNVLLFDFSAHGPNGGRSTLGFEEVGELRAAVDAVAHRGDVDATRFGLWGPNMGGYVALEEAASDPRVRALAVESVYGRPQEMVGLLVKRSGLGSVPLIARIASWGFRWFIYDHRNDPSVTAALGKLNGVAQLYFATEDDSALGQTTRAIFAQSPPPHELVELPHGNYAGMLDDEKRVYENRIVSFFLNNLPAIVEPSAPAPRH